MKLIKIIPLTKILFINTILLIIAFSNTFAGDPIEFGKEFALFTSKNAQGYFKPLFTTLGESFNTNLYTNAKHQKRWTFGMDISIMGMFIPGSQKNFDAELPEKYGYTDITQTAEMRDGVTYKNVKSYNQQPTIYGGISTPVFSAPQNLNGPDTIYKSVAFAEGNDISFMSGLPTIQLIFGFPTRTQLRVRFLTAPINNEPLYYFAFNVSHEMSQYFNFFGLDTTYGISLNAAYHYFGRDPGISINSYSFGIHASKYITPEFLVYAGLQYEGLSGEFEAVRKGWSPSDTKNSPYKEIRDGENLKFDIDSFTSIRFLAGLSYRLSILEFHADAAYASQPVLSIGMSIWFASFK